MTTEIIVAPPAPLAKVEFTTEAIALREAALEKSALVGRVSTPAENDAAVEVQGELQRISRLFEKARTEVTKPLLDAQRTIKATVDKQREELESETLRVSRLIGDFQALELQKRRAAEALDNARLAEIERERLAEIAKAKTHEQADAITERFNDLAAIATAPKPDPIRAEGQSVVVDWEITRLNEHQLARARPDLVRRIEFDMRALKDCLKRGEKLPGVEAREIVNSRVRTAPSVAIDV